MSSATQYKKEKKVIEEKLQKVRQVVPTVSNNDIILALHNYDLNVERTIQAFLEEGQGALGDWENTSKSKKASKKKAATKGNSTTSSVTDSTAGTLKQNGKSTSSTTNNGNSQTNGYNNGANAAVPASSSTKQTPKVTTSNTNHMSNGTKGKDVLKVQRHFDSDLISAEASIAQCFKEIRHAAAERERQLLAALATARSQGHQFVYDNSSLLNSIARLGEIVATNGNVIQAPVIQTRPSQEMKTATSHSSLVSSVGDDSGVGQISPVATEKSVAHVENGGIIMKSNAISADQLAEIQRQLAEQLKSQGIDPSVLAGASSVHRASQPPKRRQQNNTAKKGGNKNEKINLSLFE